MSPRRKPKGLSAEDRALWAHVTASTTPLRPGAAAPLERPLPDLPAVPAAKPQDALAPFELGRSAPKPPQSAAPALDIAHRLAQAPLRMDAKSHGRLKRGKLGPEARIDLHGMTLAQAHPALTRFILDAYGDGLRLVLVITGKGKSREDDGPIPVRRGALRHQVPQWLHMAPTGPLILQVLPAHRRHGGEGAYYVYLRRR